MFTSVAGKSVVVTGASKGIGLGIATVFAEAGAKVLLVARDEAEVAASAARLRATGASADYLVADVAVAAGCAAIASAAVERHGGLDILCTNAGIFPERRLAEMTENDIDQVLGTNLKGTMLSVTACLPALTRSGRGRVIITSSITGPYTGFPGWTHYGASKAGQLGFMRSAAVELAPRAITVNAILPGNVLTEGLAELGSEYLAKMAASVPIGRLGSVSDVGYAALYLASEEAAYVTGQALLIDGGQVLPESLEALEALEVIERQPVPPAEALEIP